MLFFSFFFPLITFIIIIVFAINTSRAFLSSCSLNLLQNLCVTAAHCPIREILEKEKKVLLLLSLFKLFLQISSPFCHCFSIYYFTMI